jgi:hypothetical protein
VSAASQPHEIIERNFQNGALMKATSAKNNMLDRIRAGDLRYIKARFA